jgi:tetratricopeptide (TPR) repeat protein
MRHIARSTATACACFLIATPAFAQQHPSTHTTADKLGSVHFATSCSPSVTPTFDHAVALLHSFEFGAAIRGFQDVIASDSSCAMAWWGIALSRWTNPMTPNIRPPALLARGLDAAQAAARATHTSDRERGYIAAVSELYTDYLTRDQRSRVVAYEKAMERLSARFPADTEARIFYAISLVASAPPTDKTYANQLKAGEMLEALFAAKPDHPGLAHYIIHSYDVPALANRASAAATRYADIAPAAAHALHMPSHTFTRVGLWQESVNTNLRSMDAAIRDSSIAEALHASDYAVYAYLQMRRDSAARVILLRLPALEARFDPNVVAGAAPGSAGVFALAAIPARYAMERRAWAEAAALVPTTSAFPYTEAMTHFARALGASHRGDSATAKQSIDSLDAFRTRLASSGEAYWAEQVAIQRIGAMAWLDLARGRRDEALTTMREAATREDATEKSAVSPGPLAPARELLADMLLELGRPADALAEYQVALTREPNRYRSVYGASRAAAAAGDLAAQAKYSQQLASLTKP